YPRGDAEEDAEIWEMGLGWDCGGCVSRLGLARKMHTKGAEAMRAGVVGLEGIAAGVFRGWGSHRKMRAEAEAMRAGVAGSFTVDGSLSPRRRGGRRGDLGDGLGMGLRRVCFAVGRHRELRSSGDVTHRVRPGGAAGRISPAREKSP